MGDHQTMVRLLLLAVGLLGSIASVESAGKRKGQRFMVLLLGMLCAMRVGCRRHRSRRCRRHPRPRPSLPSAAGKGKNMTAEGAEAEAPTQWLYCNTTSRCQVSQGAAPLPAATSAAPTPVSALSPSLLRLPSSRPPRSPAACYA